MSFLDRNLDAHRGIGKGIVTVSGAIAIAADSSVSGQTPGSGGWFTATKPAGVGIYRISLTHADGSAAPFASLYGIQCSYMSDGAGNFDRDVHPIVATPSTGVIDVQVRKTSDGTAVDPGAISTIYFTLVLKCSEVNP